MWALSIRGSKTFNVYNGGTIPVVAFDASIPRSTLSRHPGEEIKCFVCPKQPFRLAWSSILLIFPLLELSRIANITSNKQLGKRVSLFHQRPRIELRSPTKVESNQTFLCFCIGSVLCSGWNFGFDPFVILRNL